LPRTLHRYRLGRTCSVDQIVDRLTIASPCCHTLFVGRRRDGGYSHQRSGVILSCAPVPAGTYRRTVPLCQRVPLPRCPETFAFVRAATAEPRTPYATRCKPAHTYCAAEHAPLLRWNCLPFTAAGPHAGAGTGAAAFTPCHGLWVVPKTELCLLLLPASTRPVCVVPACPHCLVLGHTTVGSAFLLCLLYLPVDSSACIPSCAMNYGILWCLQLHYWNGCRNLPVLQALHLPMPALCLPCSYFHLLLCHILYMYTLLPVPGGDSMGVGAYCLQEQIPCVVCWVGAILPAFCPYASLAFCLPAALLNLGFCHRVGEQHAITFFGCIHTCPDFSGLPVPAIHTLYTFSLPLPSCCYFCVFLCAV
jgi:hypothetical protein